MERVWVPSSTEGWTEATVADYAGDSLTVYLDNEPNVCTKVGRFLTSQAPQRVLKRNTIPLYESTLMNVDNIIRYHIKCLVLD